MEFQLRKKKTPIKKKIEPSRLKPVNSVFILGVTGVIGSGKSTFCRMLVKKFGFKWINCDKLVHELYKSGAKGYQKVKKYFGSEFVGKRSVLRNKLRQEALAYPKKLLALNKLIHPLVAKGVNKEIVQIKRGNKTKKPILICIEAVYFDSKNLGKFVDRVVRIDAPNELIKKRIKKRISHEQLKRLIVFQSKKIGNTEFVINNSDNINRLYAAVSQNLIDHMGCRPAKLSV